MATAKCTEKRRQPVQVCPWWLWLWLWLWCGVVWCVLGRGGEGAIPSLKHNRNVQHLVDERKQKSNSKNCWNLSLHGHKKVRRPPSVYFPPWAGGTVRRKRREDKWRHACPCARKTPPSSFLFTHDLDTSWSQPDCTVCTSVPVMSLASVAFPEPHPLDGDLQLSSRRGWA